MALEFYESGRSEMPCVSFSLLECCRIFKASDNAVYERRSNAGVPREGKRAENDRKAKECIRNVVDGLCRGWVFGAVMLHDMIKAHYGVLVNKKRIPRLLEEMGLSLSTRWNNPYMGHDRHDHPCDAYSNLVCRRFYVAPRKIVLTDITYLWYAMGEGVFFECTFLDAFTAEILGRACSENMDTSLVMDAYNDMMELHRGEFPDDAIIHNDQGSQLLSAEFCGAAENDGFARSCSNRGNSLDNSPMESFFGTLKDENAAKLMLCDTYEEAADIVRSYRDFYNDVRTHTRIGGWIPSVFYEHCVAYESGMDQSQCTRRVPECMAGSIGATIENRRKQNKGYGVAAGSTDETEIIEKKYALAGGAEGQMGRDDEKLSRMIAKCEKELHGQEEEFQNLSVLKGKRDGILSRIKDRIKYFENMLLELKDIRGLIRKARDFYRGASETVKMRLDDRRYWKDYPDMSYYRKMKGMF